MRSLIAMVIGIAVMACAALAALHFLARDRTLASVALSQPQAYDLPDTPAEWQGQVDYQALDRQLRALAARPEMAGLAVAVVEQGTLRFVGTYGLADRSTGAVVTPQTRFRWASVSKTATGILAAQLAHAGQLDLDRPVAAWPTSLRLPNGAESRVTLAQLLAQQTGLTKNAYDERLEDGQNPALIRGGMADVPLQCDPGTCHTYQNVAFDAASEILGQAAGSNFADAVTARLFAPLGMTSTEYGMASLTTAREWARPHDNGGVRAVREAYWRVPAAAGVNGNIVDFAIWMQAMMGARPQVVPAPVLDLAQRPRVATERPYSGDLSRALANPRYGLGWRTVDYQGRQLRGHSGAVSGYRATMIFEPATQTGVVVMWNSQWGLPFRIPFAVLDNYYGRRDSAWLDLSMVPLPNAGPAAAKAPAPAGPPAPPPAIPDKNRR